MGYTSIVYDLSLTAFNIVGDLKESITYTRKGTVTYDPSTDTESSTDTTLTMDVIVVTEKATEREASQLTFYDLNILVHASSLGALVPKETDTITLRGVNYKVNKVESPPSNPIYKLYLVRL